jgi:hypothetical protein
VLDASEAEQLEALAVHRSCAGHVGARGGRTVQAEVTRRQPRWRGEDMIRKIALSLGALAVFALAVGAGFKPG